MLKVDFSDAELVVSGARIHVFVRNSNVRNKSGHNHLHNSQLHKGSDSNVPKALELLHGSEQLYLVDVVHRSHNYGH